jgi:hypothetical protein
MICHICQGSGCLLFIKHWEWWPCPCCGGAGVSVQHGPAMVGPGAPKRKFPRSEETGYGDPANRPLPL